MSWPLYLHSLILWNNLTLIGGKEVKTIEHWLHWLTGKAWLRGWWVWCCSGWWSWQWWCRNHIVVITVKPVPIKPRYVLTFTALFSSLSRSDQVWLWDRAAHSLPGQLLSAHCSHTWPGLDTQTVNLLLSLSLSLSPSPSEEVRRGYRPYLAITHTGILGNWEIYMGKIGPDMAVYPPCRIEAPFRERERGR